MSLDGALQLVAVVGTLVGAAGTVFALYTRLTFNELRRRVETIEKELRELPGTYARRDDVANSIQRLEGALSQIFAQLRRANEGIAALRGEKGTE